MSAAINIRRRPRRHRKSTFAADESLRMRAVFRVRADVLAAVRSTASSTAPAGETAVAHEDQYVMLDEAAFGALFPGINGLTVDRLRRTTLPGSASVASTESALPVSPLTAAGHLPPGVHSATRDDIEAHFVGRSAHALRRRRLEDLDWLLGQLARHAIEGDMYLYGSFLTDKEQPKDVDLIAVVRRDDFTHAEGLIRKVVEAGRNAGRKLDVICVHEAEAHDLIERAQRLPFGYGDLPIEWYERTPLGIDVEAPPPQDGACGIIKLIR
jgi:hypothetical protein